MKKYCFVFTVLVVVSAHFASSRALSQTYTTNRSPVGMEHNVLFFADQHYSVSQSGTAALSIPSLFDGKFSPSYTSSAPSLSDPTVVLIEDLPSVHTQAGAWVGWSTRWWPANRFKIEGYDVYAGANVWRTIVDHSGSNYAGYSYYVQVPPGSYAKLRFTFIAASGVDGRLGVSELAFIHPEAIPPYYRLTGWARNAQASYSLVGKVGIGTTNPQNKLDVNGTIRAKEVIVETNWADYVFDEGYPLLPLAELERYIGQHGRLPGIPSAAAVQQNGLTLGDSQRLLMEKSEEIVLYMLAQQREIEELKEQNSELKRDFSALKEVVRKEIDEN